MKKILLMLILIPSLVWANDISTLGGKAIDDIASIMGKAKEDIATVGGGGVPAAEGGPNAWYESNSGTDTGDKYTTTWGGSAVTIAADGTATQLCFYGAHNSESAVKMAVYSSDGSSKLGECNAFSLGESGRQACNLVSSFSVSASQVVWVLFQSDDTVTQWHSSSGNGKAVAKTYSDPWPATVNVANPDSDHFRVGIYVD